MVTKYQIVIINKKNMMKKIVILSIALFFLVSVVNAYTVKRGDTLSGIAQDANLSLSEVISLNPQIEDPNLIYVGDEINVGGKAVGFLGSSMQPSGIEKAIREDLVAGSSRTQTTLNVDALTTREGHRLVMSDFNAGYGYAVIDIGNSNVELIRFTGMTDNTTYYTLTGVEWGCNSYNTTCDVDTNKKRHNSGATFSITTDFHFISENFMDIVNDQTVGGVKTFSLFPLAPSDSPTTTRQFATKVYVDNSANQGAATSTEAVAGIAELATQIEMASSTQWTPVNPHVIQSQYASSTPSALTPALYVVVSENDGKINQSWLDLTESYVFSGTVTLSGTTYLLGDVATSYDFGGASIGNFFIGWDGLNVATSTLNVTDPDGNDALYVTGNATTTGSMDVGELCFDGIDCVTNNDDIKKLGSWTATTTSGSHLAETDGFVVMVIQTTSGVGAWNIKTDANETPTTVVGGADVNNNSNILINSATVPVKKDDYWKVDQVTAPTGDTSITLKWISLD